MFTATLMLHPMAAILLILGGHPWAALATLASYLLLLWLGGNGMIAAMLLKPLEAPYARLLAPRWGERNVVVMLGLGLVRPDGTDDLQPIVLSHSRILEALRLHRNCVNCGKSCKLLITGGDTAGFGATEAAICAGLALELGVPGDDLILEPESLNTFRNAELTGRIVEAHGFDRIVLVTSAFHMRRSMMYFANFRIPCEASVADCLQAIPTPVPVGVNLAMVDIAIREHLGILKYWIYSALDLNPGPRGR